MEHKRIRGQEYDHFVDRFVKAIVKRYPNVLLQWEDFATDQARALLERYKNQLCTFNDDIQGTAAVAIGGLLAALKVNGTAIGEAEIVIFGGGSAGTGIAEQIVLAMMENGLTPEEARRHIWTIDRGGLIHSGMERLSSAQQLYAEPQEAVRSIGMDLSQPTHSKRSIPKNPPRRSFAYRPQPALFQKKPFAS